MPVMDKTDKLVEKALEDALVDAVDELGDVKKAYKALIAKFSSGAVSKEEALAFSMIKGRRRELQEFLMSAGSPQEPFGEYPDPDLDEGDEGDDEDDDEEDEDDDDD